MSKSSFIQDFKSEVLLNPRLSTVERKAAARAVVDRYLHQLNPQLKLFIEQQVLKKGSRTACQKLKAHYYTKWCETLSVSACKTCDSPLKLNNVLTPSDMEFCSVACMAGNDRMLEKKKQTNLKRRGTEYPMQSKEVQAKSKATCQEKYGVDNPLQSPDIRKRIEHSLFRTYTGKCGGKRFKVQGRYEIAVLRYLVDTYGAENVRTQYSEDYPKDTFSRLGTVPDFYIVSTGTYYECKSAWTFMGRGLENKIVGEGELQANKRKARRSNKRDVVRWIIHDKKTGNLVLPLDWFALSDTKLRTRVLEHCKGRG